jgi:hypothetical protein
MAGTVGQDERNMHLPVSEDPIEVLYDVESGKVVVR